MNMEVERSLSVIEGILETNQNKLFSKKLGERVASELVGLPYYWGEYNGYIEWSESEPWKVIAHIKSKQTGEECFWKFDSMTILNHMKEIQGLSTWEEYNLAQKLAFAEEFEGLLIEYRYSEKEREEKMRDYCLKNQVPFKHYMEQ